MRFAGVALNPAGWILGLVWNPAKIFGSRPVLGGLGGLRFARPPYSAEHATCEFLLSPPTTHQLHADFGFLRIFLTSAISAAVAQHT